MPSPLPLLHLYRHLLREASLLTLPQSRTHFHRLIVSRFRHYANKYDDIANTRSSQAVQTWETALHRRGRRLLSVLTRSNHGQLRPFERVLQLTFGRKGPRRRYLMTRLMHPDSSSSSSSTSSSSTNGGIVPFPPPRRVLAAAAATTATATATSSSRTNKSRSKSKSRTSSATTTATEEIQWQPPALIQALLESQRQQQGQFTWSNYKIRAEGPAVAAQKRTTIWGKPMPRRRVKNAWARWYAVHADRLYVPLAEDEYQAIKAVARGWVKVRGLPRRPRRASTVPVFAAAGQVAVGEEGGGADDSLLLDYKGMKNKRLRDERSAPTRPITERFVQRRMAQLLKHVPRLRQPDQPDQLPTFEWCDGIDTGRFTLHETTTRQNKLLFG